MFTLLFIVLVAKCEVFHSEETICNSYNCCEQFRWRWPDVEILNKELHADIVDDNRAENTQGITFKLLAALLLCGMERNVAIKQKTRKEGYRKDNRERRYMWRYGDNAEVDITCLNQKVIDSKIPQCIEYHIRGTAHAIAKELT